MVLPLIRYIGPNPRTSFTPHAAVPAIHHTAFVGPFSTIIGDVRIGPEVFIAPNVSIRADEGTPFHIGEGSNVQDGAILHGIMGLGVRVDDAYYSIFIDRSVTVAHGAIVHGPAFVGEGSFVGFQSLVFQAVVGKDVYIANNAVVMNNVRLRENSFVPPNTVVDTQEKADLLGQRPQSAAEFAKQVQQAGREFASGYSLMFGNHRCSCGISYDL